MLNGWIIMHNKKISWVRFQIKTHLGCQMGAFQNPDISNWKPIHNVAEISLIGKSQLIPLFENRILIDNRMMSILHLPHQIFTYTT